MKKLFTFFTLAIMGFVAAFAAEEATETATATIIVNTGEQYEEDPVEGATVTFMGKEYTTPENGIVEILGLSEEDVVGKKIPFTAYKDGYEFYEGEVDFSETMNGYAIATLTPAEATLTVIVHAEEEPVEGAFVYFQDKEAMTNENGQAVITGISFPEVAGKKIPVSVYKDGYEFFEGVADFSETMEAYVIASLAPAEATLTIKVVAGDDNDPIQGATVTFQGEDYVTPENGEVKITGISGPAVIGKGIEYFVYKDGYDFFEGVADFTETLEAYEIVVLAPAEVTLSIKVTAADYEPIEGATVKILSKELTTDESGTVNISGLNAPDVLGTEIPYSVYKEGFVFFEGKAIIDMLEAQSWAELKAVEGYLTVNVLYEEAPVANAMVTFQGGEYTTDEKGVAKIGLSSSVMGETVPYTVYKDGYEFFEGKVDFAEGLDTSVTATLVPAKASLSIKVMAEGEPVEGATVTFQGKEYTSNENGEVKIEDLNGPDVMGKTIPFTVYVDGYNVYKGEAEFIETLEPSVVAELVAFDASITVKVMAGEDPVAEAMVSFDGNDYLTDANGEVVITGIHGPSVIGKTLPITVSKDGYETFEGEVDFTEILEAYVVVELVNIQTGINAIFNDIKNADAKVYDLNGRRVINPKNGQVYIVNGMKVLLNR